MNYSMFRGQARYLMAGHLTRFMPGCKSSFLW